MTLLGTSVKTLDVYLSGGASSLAWIPARVFLCVAVIRRLKILYRKPLDIRELNRERAKLCQLKQGGVRANSKIDFRPGLKIRVFYVSDVAPFGPEVLGGGPFLSRGISHQSLADNERLRTPAATQTPPVVAT